MKYKSFILLLLLLAAGLLYAGIAENAGEYGFKFLLIPLHPASMAMAGRAPDALSNPTAFINQPALNTVERQRSLGVSHTRWLADTDFTSVYYSYSQRRNHFGLAMRNLSYGEIEKRDDAGNLIGTYNPLDMSLLANYSIRLTPSQYIGANAGVVYEKLATASSVGISTDIGYTLLPPLQDARLSVSLRNMGISSRMNDERIKFPLTMEMDLSKGFGSGDTHLLVGGSLTKVIDEELKGTVNAELSLRQMLILRSGWRINYSGEYLSLGVGFRFSGFGVDYAWAESAGDLNSVHSFGLSYHF